MLLGKRKSGSGVFRENQMGSPKNFGILTKFYTKQKYKMLDITGFSKSQASNSLTWVEIL